MTREVSVLVNGAPIEIDYFVQGFIDHTIGGMLAALEGTGEMHNGALSINGELVAIDLNGSPVPLNPFVSKIIRNIMVGMVSSLKGVSEINKLDVSIRR